MPSKTRVYDYKDELAQLRDMETLFSFELLVQTALVAACSIAAWVFLDLWQIPLWFTANYGLILVEKALLTRNLGASSKGRYFGHLLLSFCIASTAACLPIFLWSNGDALLRYAALAYMVGATLNTFLIRSRSWQVMLCYMLPNSAVFFAISFNFILSPYTNNQGILAFGIALAITLYFLTSIVEATRQHRENLSTRQELLQAQRLETLGSLSGGIAHDFNNLLSIISGNLELLRDGSSIVSKDDLIEQSLQASQRGANLTQKFLAFGRQSSLTSRPINVEVAFFELEELLARLIPEAIELRIKVATETPPIFADEDALYSAIFNLAINARDASNGHGIIKITAARYSTQDSFDGFSTLTDETQDFVKISVSDSGVGIAPEFLDSTIEPYFTSKPFGKGAGLGLAMVSGFATQSGGGIRIWSQPSVGTTVDLILPASKVSAEDKRSSKSFEKFRQCSNSQVLVVEDEHELLEILEQHLETDGYSVKTAGSGDEALSLLRCGLNPNLIITDVVMPGKTQGLELVQAASKIDAQTRFIVMSGYAPPSDELSPDIAKRVHYMKKPFLLSDLSDVIRARLLGDVDISEAPNNETVK